MAERARDGLTPLHYAASSVGARDDSPAVVRLLLARGADLGAKSTDGRAPADVAFNRAEMAAVLHDLLR